MRASAKATAAAASPAMARLRSELTATKAAYRETHLAAVDVYEMVLEMERQGAIRLPWHGHGEKMTRLGKALGR